jgi:hypothetical protein
VLFRYCVSLGEWLVQFSLPFSDIELLHFSFNPLSLDGTVAFSLASVGARGDAAALCGYGTCRMSLLRSPVIRFVDSFAVTRRGTESLSFTTKTTLLPATFPMMRFIAPRTMARKKTRILGFHVLFRCRPKTPRKVE